MRLVAGRLHINCILRTGASSEGKQAEKDADGNCIEKMRRTHGVSVTPRLDRAKYEC